MDALNLAVSSETVLPSLWTIAAFLTVWLLLWLPLAAGVLLTMRQGPQFPVPAGQKIPLLIVLYILAPMLVWLYAHRIADTTLAAYGWAWQTDLLVGLLFGAGLGIGGVGLLSGVQVVAGWSTFQPGKVSWPASLGLTIAIGTLTLFISTVEELVFRGFIVNQLQTDYPAWGVAIAACALFALLHLVWDGPAGIPNLPGLTLMGAVLLLARWSNHGLLGLPVGLHWGWIWSLALLDETGIVTQAAAPAWIVGRPGQPLTSPLVLGLLGVTGLVVWGV